MGPNLIRPHRGLGASHTTSAVFLFFPGFTCLLLLTSFCLLVGSLSFSSCCWSSSLLLFCFLRESLIFAQLYSFLPLIPLPAGQRLLLLSSQTSYTLCLKSVLSHIYSFNYYHYIPGSSYQYTVQVAVLQYQGRQLTHSSRTSQEQRER
ncbi:hypothetical protein F4680DRAFT_280662 [Xylaria scruposa]|nr:hypothetical protein F4680DRAFT_280662 [Xylaria scruposa]